MPGVLSILISIPYVYAFYATEVGFRNTIFISFLMNIPYVES